MDNITYPDSKVHGANMGPTWVLLVPDGAHVGPMNLAIRVYIVLQPFNKLYIDGSEQDCSNSSALAMQSYTNP